MTAPKTRDFSESRRIALAYCLAAGSLHLSGGLWHGRAGTGIRIMGNVIADLRRDGLMQEPFDSKNTVVELTERGRCIARQLADDRVPA